MPRGANPVRLSSGATSSGARALARVLVVDDDPVTERSIILIAERESLQIVCVNDGRKASRILRSDANFAAVVLNIMMPQVDGVDLLRHLKTEKRLARIPVVIVAGDPGLKLIADSFAAGALIFLAKPFTTGNLIRTLRLAISSQSDRKDVAQTSETIVAA